MINLDPQYSWDTFCVKPENRLAHAAAMAVIESPGVVYNPLFIYGDSGKGKTHLLSSIGLSVQGNDEDARVFYTNPIKFAAEIQGAVRYNDEKALYRRYEAIDVLLFDDIHYFSGREITQDVFYKVFNHLFIHHKQMVFASIIHPSRIKDLQERLYERFTWGLITGV